MEVIMNNSNGASVRKKEKEESFEKQEVEIIPWPDMEAILEKKDEKPEFKKVRLDQKFIYYKDKKIPILQFQKSGYDKILKFLVKGIGN